MRNQKGLLLQNLVNMCKRALQALWNFMFPEELTQKDSYTLTRGWVGFLVVVDDVGTGIFLETIEENYGLSSLLCFPICLFYFNTNHSKTI